MEWEPNDTNAWVVDAERWIARIKGVLQCKIDLDLDGEVSAVHVVANEERPPRRIVRDVEGLLKARLGIAVYYKKISVVQMMDLDEEERAAEAAAGTALPPVATKEVPPPPMTEAQPEPQPAPSPKPESPPLAEVPPPEPVRPDFGFFDLPGEDESMPAVLLEESVGPRIICGGVGVMTSEQTVRAEVELSAGLVEARGSEEGPNHVDCDLTLIGRATIDAVRQLINEPVLLNLSDVRIQDLGGRDLALAAVELVEGRRSERLFGTCSTEHNRSQAVVYAVLDALNRRLSLMALKTGEEEA